MLSCKKRGLLSLLLASILGVNVQSLGARTTSPVGNVPDGALLPTGQTITPTAAPGSILERLPTGLRSDGTADAAEAVTTALSPDGKTLLILTSGYNKSFKDEKTGASFTYPVLNPMTGLPGKDSTGKPVTTNKAEWVFVCDVRTGKLVKKQQLNIPNTYDGIAWAPDSKRFYVSAGGDDRIYVYINNNSQFAPDPPFILLDHNSNQTAPFPSYDGNILKETPAAVAGSSAIVAGIAVSKDGKTLVAANFANDSISVVDTSTRKVLKEVKFFVPGSKVATGEYPYYVANAEPMSDVFTQTPDLTPYQAIVPGNLCALPQGATLVPACKDPSARRTAAVPSTHDRNWWAAATKGFDFEVEDNVDVEKFNRILWAGVKGDRFPYPTVRSRADLRRNRAQLLKNWQLSTTRISAATTNKSVATRRRWDSRGAQLCAHSI